MFKPKFNWFTGIALVLGLMMTATGAQADSTDSVLGQPQIAQLYFSGSGGRHLKAQALEMAEGKTATEMAKRLIQHLVDGPRMPLGPVLPAETTLRSIFVAKNGTAYVDFTKAIVDRLPGGVTPELFAVYSIANTLVLNSAAIDRVQLLIEGKPAQTLAGHIDISRPLGPNTLLIR